MRHLEDNQHGGDGGLHHSSQARAHSADHEQNAIGVIEREQLAAEASHLSLLQLLIFFIAFFLLFYSACPSDREPTDARHATANDGTPAGRILDNLSRIDGPLSLRFRIGHGRRARRLDIVLCAVQRNRALPIMD